jgi:hypothetical protein
VNQWKIPWGNNVARVARCLSVADNRTHAESPTRQSKRSRARANLPTAQKLLDIVGSKEEYNASREEEGDLPDLTDYIGERIESFLIKHENEKKLQPLREKFSRSMVNFKCECGYGMDQFLRVGSLLTCSHCGRQYNMVCPACRRHLEVDDADFQTTIYRCPSCKLEIAPPKMLVRYFASSL